MRILPAFFLLVLSACSGDPKGDTSAPANQDDADQDGFTDVAVGGTDCDDNDAAVNPDATEVCDGVDNDCSGAADDNASDGTTYYLDGDEDGYGDAASTVVACEAPTGAVSDASDCDDNRSDINPGAAEACDDEDNDCDGTIDEDAPLWYTDADADGYGDAANATAACSQPTGTVSDATDCDDTNATINPAAAEVCDSVDNDCDALTDDADDTLSGAPAWYADTDADGYGDMTAVVYGCTQPEGYVDNGSDCGDTNSAISPTAMEVCNDGVDDDCDGLADDADDTLSGGSTWYADTDGDGYAGDLSTTACVAPEGYAATTEDCDDTDATVYPGATDYCDRTDSDCDGDLTDGSDPSTWYTDADSDGYGDPASAAVVSCSAPSAFGYADNADDCDDTDYTLPSVYYYDGDGDGDGDESLSGIVSCEALDGYVAYSNYDCDDTNPDVSSTGTEYCDGLDNNCNGSVDAGWEVTFVDWYADADSDGYGDANTSTTDCVQPAGYVSDTTDCDDTDATINPGAVETVGDGVDSDCKGNSDYDGDGDGWETTDYGGDDCDDTASDVYPYAVEDDADGVDNDCDGLIDADDPNLPTWYVFADDEVQEIAFSGFSFPFCGTDWSSVYVASNGYLIFGDAYSSYTESETDFGRYTMIAGLWDDLNPSADGLIGVVEYGDAVGVYYDGVPEYGLTTTNSFSIVLFADGTIWTQHGSIASLDHIVGWTCGTGIPTEVDLTATTAATGAPGIGSGTENGLYELFDGTTSAEQSDVSGHRFGFCGPNGTDADGDGYTDTCGDTDDTDPSVHP